jgi:hypothetical protein
MVNRLVSVGDDFTLPAAVEVADTNLPARLQDTALNATYVPKWKPTTAYLAGDAVLSPAGDTVTAIANFTSGASYNAANWNLSQSYPAKGGASKSDGQNIKNLRRPVLTVDSMFPNARTDHQILWVDEALGRAYALGADGGLRLQTWTAGGASQDIGAFTASPKSFPASTQTWAFHGLFFRTAAGALLMEQQDAGVTTLQRSTSASDGAAWTTVYTAPGDVIPLGPTALAQDAVTGYLYFVEYSSGTSLTTINIMRSTDDGVTWTIWKSMPKAASGGGGSIRHWHGTRYDSISQRVYFCAGDQNDIAGIYRVNAGGTDIEPIVLNNQIAAQFGMVAPARCIDIMFFPDYIAWGNDGGGGQNYIYRMARTQLGQPNPVVEQVAAIDNTSWWAQKVRTDGSMWVCSSSSEVGGSLPVEDKGVAHLYAVGNNGATVDEVAAVSMEGIYGAGSLSCLSSTGSGGDVFWLRAHAYQEFPYKTASAFQFRAKIGYGAVPLVKPRNNRPAVYVSQTRDTVMDLTASQTRTFGHTRVPYTKNLYILDMGVKTITGTANSVTLQVYNVTTSTVVHTLTASTQSWRHGFSATQEYAYKYLLATSDQIEFRVVETLGAPATVSAYIVFGFGA